MIPAGLRESQGWTDDTVLVFVEDADGSVRMMSRDGLLASIRAQLAGSDPVNELLAERRAEAEREDHE